MRYLFSKTSAVRALLAGLLLMQLHAWGQEGREQAAAPPSVSTAPPVDLTGYWASVITQNWRLRMVTPAKGDYMGIPLTADAKKLADAWDPAKDEASGNQCKGYGAASIMMMPERLHITWQDTKTLRMDIDAGTQTRLLHFAPWTATSAKRTWQGESVAEWKARRGPGVPPSTPQSKYLKIVTTQMLPGYLRRNGIPYGEKASLTEYYDLIQEKNGDRMLLVTTVVEDPVYLQDPLILSTQFKKQADASGWNPSPCSAKW
jgi:hypothetical protein